VLEAAILSELHDTTAVTDLVGNTGLHYRARVPQDETAPWCSIFRITDTPDRVQSGQSGESLQTAQIDCVARDYATAHDVFKAVEDALDNFTGTLGSGDAALHADDVAIMSSGAAVQEPTEGSETGYVQYSATVEAWYDHS